MMGMSHRLKTRGFESLRSRIVVESERVKRKVEKNENGEKTEGES